MKKIIVFNRNERQTPAILKENFEITYFNNVDPKKDPQFLEVLQEAEGIVGVGLPVDKEFLDNAPNLKIVSNISTGYNNFDVDEMTKRGVMGTNTAGALEDTTADAIFGILLAAARRIAELDRYVKEKRWNELLREEFFGVNVHHKTLGIIGMGKIGSVIAKRAHCGFDMDILYYNRSRNSEAEQKYNAKYCTLDELLQQSDFVVLMTPLTPETEKLIGAREFKLMKKSAIFVNGSRGKTVDEQALIEAIQNKEILGAALDVFEQEPIHPDNPLLTFPNVVTTPHIGSATYETETKMFEVAAKNLISGLSGETPPNLVTGQKQ